MSLTTVYDNTVALTSRRYLELLVQQVLSVDFPFPHQIYRLASDSLSRIFRISGL